MAIDLIVQHVHSQLEEVRAVCPWVVRGVQSLAWQRAVLWVPRWEWPSFSCAPSVGVPVNSSQPLLQSREGNCLLCSGWSWLLCQLWSSSSFLPSLGQQVMRGQTRHPPVI